MHQRKQQQKQGWNQSNILQNIIIERMGTVLIENCSYFFRALREELWYNEKMQVIVSVETDMKI